MADKQLRYVVSGVDKGASTAIKGVEHQATSSTAKIGGAFSKMSSAIGGDVGEVLDKIGAGFDNVGERGGRNLGAKLAVGGAAVATLGALLVNMGSADQAAQQQLANAIDNTGHSFNEFKKPIGEVITAMTKFGYTDETVNQSLQTLVNATHDPTKAIALMGEAADLAASKHLSLQDAATQLARVIGGKGGRTLAQYNIQLVKNADGTTNWAKTNLKLAAVLSGQASAASDTWTGKLKAMGAKLENITSDLAQKFGPALTAAGVAMTLIGSVAQVAASRAIIANQGLVASELEVAAAADKAAVSVGGVGASSGLGGALRALGGASLLAAPIAAALAIDQIGSHAEQQKSVLDRLGTQLHNLFSGKFSSFWGGIKTNNLLGGIADNHKVAADSTAKAQAAFNSINPQAFNLSGPLEATAGAQALATQAANRAAFALGLESKSATALSTAFKNLNSTTMDEANASLAFRDAEQNVIDAVKQNGKSLDVTKVSGRANTEAVLSAIQAAQAHAVAVQQQTGSVNRATDSFHNDIDALKRHLIQMGLNKAEVNRLITQFGKIPPMKQTRIDVLSDEAQRKAKLLADTIAGIPSEKYVNVVLNGQGNANRANQKDVHRASGGPVTAGQSYVVNENGQETFIPGVNGVIMPNGRGGGSSVTVHVHVAGSVITEQGITQAVVNGINEHRRRTGNYTSVLKG